MSVVVSAPESECLTTSISPEVAKELELTEWVVKEAVIAHESAKSIALKNGKPIPLGAIRVAIQAQNRRMSLLGLAPIVKRIPKATTAEMAVWAEKTLQNITKQLPETPVVPLSRQQRRALEREQAKLTKQRAA